MTDSLSHTKSHPTQGRVCVHNHHQILALKKYQSFPFIDSSNSILCSIKAYSHIFPATLSLASQPHQNQICTVDLATAELTTSDPKLLYYLLFVRENSLLEWLYTIFVFSVLVREIFSLFLHVTLSRRKNN